MFGLTLSPRALAALFGSLAAFAILAVAFMAGQHRGERIARDELAPKLSTCVASLSTVRGNAARLQSSLDEQSAATLRLAQAEAARKAEASKLLQAASEREGALRASIDRLRRSAAQPSAGGCNFSDAALEAWK